VDPWGKIILDMGTEEGIGYAEIDLDLLFDVRKKMPVLTHT
jgi:predicted amidohydrolase